MTRNPKKPARKKPPKRPGPKTDLRSAWQQRLERLAIRLTGRIRRNGRLFDMRHPRMIDGIRQALEKGTYEGREIGMIRRHVRREDRVIELGVCIGATTMVLHDLVGSERLVVYEADPRNLELARRNFRLNHLVIRCENAVLLSGDDRPPTVTFRSNENPSSSSLAEREGSEMDFTVPTRDLEEALSAHGVTALVLDIEGGEVPLFEAAGEMPGLRLIILEAHERVVGEEANARMLESLEAKGFRIVEDVGRKYIVLERAEAPAAA